MAIITFTSDFGTKEHYVAAVKAKVYAFNPNVKVVDISHDVKPHDIGHGAYILGSVFRDFPKGTVHLVAISAQSPHRERWIALKIEEHFFVGEDNGFFSLLTDKKPTAISELAFDVNATDTFPEKNILAKAAVSLASGSSVYDLGRQLLETKVFRHREPLFYADKVECHVKHIDTFGNIITNLSLEMYEKQIGSKFDYLQVRREEVNGLHKHYKDVAYGECVAFFNSDNWLQISISYGDASELLGVGLEDSVFIYLRT